MAAAVIRDGDRVVLVQNRWAIGTFWSLPGGRIEPGEAAVDAVVREVREETGLQVRPGDLAYVLETFNRELNYQFLYLVFPAQVEGGALRAPEADEFTVDARWVPVDEIPRYMTWPVYRDTLLQYLGGDGRRYRLNRDAGLKPPQ